MNLVMYKVIEKKTGMDKKGKTEQRTSNGNTGYYYVALLSRPLQKITAPKYSDFVTNEKAKISAKVRGTCPYFKYLTLYRIAGSIPKRYYCCGRDF